MALHIAGASIDRLGWVIIHSCWQFAMFAVITGVLMQIMQRRSAFVRYCSLTCLFLGLISVPVVTWCALPQRLLVSDASHVLRQNGSLSSSQKTMESLSDENEPRQNAEQAFVASEPASTRESARPPGSAESMRRPPASLSTAWVFLQTALQPWLYTIVTVWCIGVLIFALRPVVGWYTLRRLRRVGTVPVPKGVQLVLERTAEQLHLRPLVHVLQSTLVKVPVATGYFRPVILLPVSIVSGLPIAQLEAILAHELAHIRRYDYLINLLQTLVETLFFYHPAVWWMSRLIRCERENCCDDIAVAVTGNRIEYGRALLALEELRGPTTSLAMSALRRLPAGTSASDRRTTWRRRLETGGCSGLLADAGLASVGRRAVGWSTQPRGGTER